MALEDENDIEKQTQLSAAVATEPVTQPPPSPAVEEVYTIFDRRQKAFIVAIVSTAATCMTPNLFS